MQTPEVRSERRPEGGWVALGVCRPRQRCRSTLVLVGLGGWGARAKPPMDNQSVIMHMKLETAIPSVTAHIGFPCTLPESPSPGDFCNSHCHVATEQEDQTKNCL